MNPNNEELLKAATKYFLENNGTTSSPWAIDSTGLGMPVSMAEFGAEWALDHQWVSTSERLPEEEFDDGYTFVFVNIEIDEDTSRFDVDYIRDGHWEIHPEANITHWMKIPKLPKTE